MTVESDARVTANLLKLVGIRNKEDLQLGLRFIDTAVLFLHFEACEKGTWDRWRSVVRPRLYGYNRCEGTGARLISKG